MKPIPLPSSGAAAKTAPSEDDGDDDSLSSFNIQDKPSPSIAANSATDAVTYNPPPTYWLFGRGNSSKSNNNNASSNKLAKQDLAENTAAPSPAQEETAAVDSSSPPLLVSPLPSPPSSSAKQQQHHLDNWKMVSDNEDEDDDNDHEAFNFVPISNSLLMAGRAFDNVNANVASLLSSGREGAEENDDGKNTTNSCSRDGISSSFWNVGVDVDVNVNVNEQQHHEGGVGVLIVNGIVGKDGCQETETDNIHINNNTNGASFLTLPGSDSLPSEIGTISYHDDYEDDDEDCPFLGEQGNKNDDKNVDVDGRPGFSVDVDVDAVENDQELREEAPWQGPSRLPLVHRFLNDLHQQSRRRSRLPSDMNADVNATGDKNEDEIENASSKDGGRNQRVPSTGVDAQNDDRSEAGTIDPSYSVAENTAAKLWPSLLLPLSSSSTFVLSSSARKPRFLLLLLVLFVISAASFAGNSVAKRQRKLQETWEERLRFEEHQTAKLYAETKRLQEGMQALLEEAAMANAKAESLAKEQERLLLERRILEQAVTSADERLRLLEEEREKQQQKDSRQQQRSRRRNNDDADASSSSRGRFGWFFDDENENCRGHQDDDPSSFTLVDNCWFKAKASIDFGSCGDETKDYFKGIWNGLWEDLENLYNFDSASGTIQDGSTTTAGAVEPYSTKREEEEEGQRRPRDNGQDDYQYQYQTTDDTYYPPEDPLKDLYSALHSAGHSFVAKLTRLMTEEAETTDEDSESSKAVAFRGKLSEEEYKNVLSTLRAVAINNNRNKNGEWHNNTKTTTNSLVAIQQVTQKGLLDAADALTSLSKAWQENTKSQQLTVEVSEVARE
mmetsp:Transcript_19283/g.40617  ORF Transcript_19283/g.40617 Transcript_19283/m.40617 type:complete len:841 (+) Transcript_19283:171-2693(+)